MPIVPIVRLGDDLVVVGDENYSVIDTRTIEHGIDYMHRMAEFLQKCGIDITWRLVSIPDIDSLEKVAERDPQGNFVGIAIDRSLGTNTGIRLRADAGEILFSNGITDAVHAVAS